MRRSSGGMGRLGCASVLLSAVFGERQSPRSRLPFFLQMTSIANRVGFFVASRVIDAVLVIDLVVQSIYCTPGVDCTTVPPVIPPVTAFPIIPISTVQSVDTDSMRIFWRIYLSAYAGLSGCTRCVLWG